MDVSKWWKLDKERMKVVEGNGGMLRKREGSGLGWSQRKRMERSGQREMEEQWKGADDSGRGEMEGGGGEEKVPLNSHLGPTI